MNKFFINLICAFIPFKEKRNKFRKKLLSHSLEAKQQNLFVSLLKEMQSEYKGIMKKQLELEGKIGNLQNIIQENIPNTLQENFQNCLNDSLNNQNQLLKTWYDVSINPSSLPKASGNLRLLQIADTEILRILTEIFSKYNLSYWLDFGTLLGAQRHNGFVPWDDDMDIAMLREDYDKLFNILDIEFKDTPLFYYGKTETFLHSWDTFIRIRCKNTSLNIDIFPYDCYFKKVQTDLDRQELSEKMIKGREFYSQNFPIRDGENEEKLINLRKMFAKYTFDKINEGQRTNLKAKPTIFKGIENWAYFKPFYYDFETIFPLQKKEFEGIEFYIPNRPDKYLKNIYGDYMKIPLDLNRHGNIFLQEIPDDFDRIIDVLKSIKR